MRRTRRIGVAAAVSIAAVVGGIIACAGRQGGAGSELRSPASLDAQSLPLPVDVPSPTQVPLPAPKPPEVVARDPFGESDGDGTEASLGPSPGTGQEVSVREGIDIGGTEAMRELLRAIADVEGQGCHVSVMLSSTDGEELLSYDADRAMYPASAAKGPYVLAVWDQQVGDGEPSEYLSSLTEAILGWSDNDSYHAMRDAYGTSPVVRLAGDAGCDLSWYGGDAWGWAEWNYPRTSARDLSRMWVREVPYVLGDGAGPAALREMFSEREVSPIRDAMPPGAGTWTKAGWLPEGGDYDSTPAAVDAGIVRWEATGRSYVAVVMTDTREDMEAVRAVAAALDRCHFAICGRGERTPGE